jgi:hypothetical protein
MLTYIMGSIIGCGVYNIIANKINNMRYEEAGVNDPVTVFDAPWLCPIASAYVYDNMNITQENKWDFGAGKPNYRMWRMPTFSVTPTIIYRIDGDYTMDGKPFSTANIRFIC